MTNRLTTDELWNRFVKYEKLATDEFMSGEMRATWASLADSIARLLAGRMP